MYRPFIYPSYLSIYLSIYLGNELFYGCLYLIHFTTGPLYVFPLLAVVTAPVAVAKSGIALLQVHSIYLIFLSICLSIYLSVGGIYLFYLLN